MTGQPRFSARSQVADILAAVLAPQPSGMSMADRLCVECVGRMDVSGAGLVLMRDRENLGVVAVTDGPAAQIEELQFATGEGPCVDAFRAGRPVLQPDLHLTAIARWPGFGSAVLASGVRAIFAFPLQIGAIRIGVLDLYRNSPGPLADADLSAALAFADAATLILLHLQERPDVNGADPVIGAIDNRAVVHQATGMIAVQLGVSLAEALLRLQAYAYASEQTIAGIAADVVSRRTRFGDSDPETSLSQA